MNEEDFRKLISGISKPIDGKKPHVETMKFMLEMVKLELMFELVKEIRSIAVEVESLKHAWEQRQA